jgi:hypothetical protein
MAIDKEYYRKLGHNGYTWVGFWKGLHHFQKDCPPTRTPISETEAIVTFGGTKHVSLTEEMLDNGNLQFMLERDLSYSIEDDPRLTRKEKKELLSREAARERIFLQYA